jgi:sn-glycerol 3-phosphate transport system substrate-binding protein
MDLTRRAALAATAAATVTAGSRRAFAATDIDLFFPVPVQGKLAIEMQRLIREFNTAHPDINVTPVYTGSYDDTNLKTRSAIQAGRPPAAVIMSANFVREYVINDETIPLDPLLGDSPAAFMDRFWPALRTNAMDGGHVYGVPFHNSTPLLYYSVDAFKEAGLDPDQPPKTWAEWVAAAQKLTKRDGANTIRWGLMLPGTYDYLGWLTSALAMSDGGEFYNERWGGEVYFDSPSTIGAITLIDDMVHKYKVMPEGVTDANACTSAFFSGRAAMMMLSTGSLSFVGEGMKSPFKVAYVPFNIANAAPIGGASLIIPKGNSPERQKAAWTLIQWLTSPEVSGGWSRFTGYFSPVRAAYDLPAMKDFLQEHPNAKIALDQLNLYGRSWFATYNTVGVRKALEDQVQAVLAGRTKPVEAAKLAQRNADVLLKPYVEQTAMKLPE